MFKVKLMRKIWQFNRKPFTLHTENKAYSLLRLKGLLRDIAQGKTDIIQY